MADNLGRGLPNKGQSARIINFMNILTGKPLDTLLAA
jgi:hypothetical protein